MLINADIIITTLTKRLSLNAGNIRITKNNSQMTSIYINGLHAYEYGCFDNLNSVLDAVSQFYRGYMAGIMLSKQEVA